MMRPPIMSLQLLPRRREHVRSYVLVTNVSPSAGLLNALFGPAGEHGGTAFHVTARTHKPTRITDRDGRPLPPLYQHATHVDVAGDPA